jgi:hypothetical protein
LFWPTKFNLIGAIGLLYDDGFSGALGLADADFDRLSNTLPAHEGLIFSEKHDFDLDWACHAVLSRYLAEVAHSDKCDADGGIDGVTRYLLDAVKPLSVLRYLSHRQKA